MSNEIIFLKDVIIKIDDITIQKMKEQAFENDSGKLRYCFHENENAGMQEMLFVMPRKGYARPHMHREVAETHVVIEGEGICVLFDNAGNIIESFKISRKDNFIYRIQKNIWHMVLPISEQMVIYEVREGSFDSNTSIFPEWAPKTDEIEQIELYKQNILEKAIGGK